MLALGTLHIFQISFGVASAGETKLPVDQRFDALKSGLYTTSSSAIPTKVLPRTTWNAILENYLGQDQWYG